MVYLLGKASPGLGGSQGARAQSLKKTGDLEAMQTQHESSRPCYSSLPYGIYERLPFVHGCCQWWLVRQKYHQAESEQTSTQAGVFVLHICWEAIQLQPENSKGVGRFTLTYLCSYSLPAALSGALALEGEGLKMEINEIKWSYSPTGI